MFFEELTLHRCRRFKASGHELVRIKPTSKVQLVLGSNGSGKSSLLDIGFTVMPPAPNDFYKRIGYKEVIVRHKDGRYCLRTDYKGSSGHHSFIDLNTGEELNKGSTLGVQKELIESVFGMTTEIHDLLVGKTRFTRMTPAKRQEWITKMSEADFTYALRYYSDVCKSERANKSVLKHQTERLSSSISNLLPETEVTRLKERARSISDELNYLLAERDPYSEDAVTVHRKVRTAVEMLMRDSSMLLMESRKHNVPVFAGGKALTVEDIFTVKANLQAKLGELDGSIKELAAEQDYLERKLVEIRELEGIDEQELTTRLAAVEAAIRETEQQFERYTYFRKPLSCQGKTYLRDEIEVFIGMLSDVDTPMDQESYKSARKELDQHRELLRGELVNKANLDRELEHISKCAEVACPSCHTEFKPGIDANRPAEITRLLSELEAGIWKREEAINYLGGIVVSWEAARDYEDSIRGFMQTHFDLTELWTEVSKRGLSEKLVITSICHEYKEALKSTKRFYQLQEERLPIAGAIDRCKSREDMSEVSARYDHVVNRLQDAMGPRKRTYTKALDRLDHWDRHTVKCNELYSTLKGYVAEITAGFEQLGKAIRQDCMQEVITQHQGELANINSSLSKVAIQEGLVADLKQEVMTLETDAVAFELIRKILSPEDGEIAKQISLHIGRLMNRLNKWISKIWGYPMTVLPCGNEDGSLNYKFPVRIKDSDDDIDDIACGSRSQTDIIDEAFRRTAVRAMKLEEVPLYLDEFGSSFDTLHRTSLLQVLEDDFEDPVYGQVFMISHYMEGYGGFSTAEIIVLDDSNVTVQGEYNTHVELK